MSTLRYATRRLRAQPLFTLTIVGTLALGIGATTAIFTVVDETVLRVAPFAGGDRLVDVLDTNRETGGGGNNLTPAKVVGWQSERAVFEAFEAYAPRQFDLAGTGVPERVQGLLVSLDLLPMLGVQPRIGRGFGPGDGAPDSEPVVLIGEGLWRRRFGADPAAIGDRILLNDREYTIVGVMPRRFHLLSDEEALWLPIDLRRATAGPDVANLYGLARLAPGVTASRAQTLADALADRRQHDAPLALTWDLSLSPKRVASVDTNTRGALFILLGAVGFVLLLVCANVATLFLSKAAPRQREVAIRSALGASRASLMAEVLSESLLLSVAGGALGVLLAEEGVTAVLAMAPARFAFMTTTTVEVDGRILAAATGMTLLAGLASGVLPAWRGSRPNLDRSLRDGAALRNPRQAWAPSALVAAELAIALVLLTGAMLLTRTLLHLEALDPGFEPRQVIAMHLDLPSDRYPAEAERSTYFRAVTDRLRALPGVSDAAVASGLPPALGGFRRGPIQAEGQAPGPSAIVPLNNVSPEYFRALGVPLRAGRTFQPQDTRNDVIVSRALADRLWPGRSAIGRRFRMSGDSPWQTVIGVAGNVEGRAAGEERTALAVYSPFVVSPVAARVAARPTRRSYAWRILIVRAPDPAARLDEIKQAIWSVDPAQPIEKVSLGTDLYAEGFARQRFVLILLSLFAGIAIALAMAGVFALLAELVAQRTREIGIRVALGATPAAVVRLVVGRGMALAGAGAAAGIGIALLAARALRSLLFEVSPHDPAALGLMTLLLAAAALAACWIPVRSALRVNPAVALRAD